MGAKGFHVIKEELIKLVTQKEEQLRAAEDLAEKRERSNIKFARGVTSLALLLKDVNGSYLAQVEEYLSYADDEEAKKAMKVLYDMISYGIKTIGVTSVQIASFFAHGNEAMKAGETSEQAYAKAQSNLKELRQVCSFTNNVKGIVKLSNAIAKASKTLDASTNATVKTLQEISEINKESEPSLSRKNRRTGVESIISRIFRKPGRLSRQRYRQLAENVENPWPDLRT